MKCIFNSVIELRTVTNPYLTFFFIKELHFVKREKRISARIIYISALLLMHHF